MCYNVRITRGNNAAFGKIMQPVQNQKLNTSVYVAPIPEDFCDETELLPAERQAQVSAIGNPKVKTQKRFVWELLRFALERRLGIPADLVNFSRSGNKWSCAECRISLSHTDGYVAVALSDLPVGVDVEVLSPKFSEKLLDRIACPPEKQARGAIQTAALWTAKESLFKQGDNALAAFVPSKICVIGAGVSSYSWGDVALSVATDRPIDLFLATFDQNGGFELSALPAESIDLSE